MLPIRPLEATALWRGLSDKIWNLLLRCWARDPKERPHVTGVLTELRRLLQKPILEVQDLTEDVVVESISSEHVRGGFGEIKHATLKDGTGVALKTIIGGFNQLDLRKTKVSIVGNIS